MGRAPSQRIKGPLGSGNSLLHRQIKTEPKGGCLEELPPAELYLGGASCLQQDKLLLWRQLVQVVTPHLIFLWIASMSGAPQNRQHGEKLHGRLAAWKATAEGRWVASPGKGHGSFKDLRKPKYLSLAYWLLNKKGQNTVSSFMRSSLLISFAFTTCVQKWSVSFGGSEGVFQCTWGCPLFISWKKN